jgi:hypothetical protein
MRFMIQVRADKNTEAGVLPSKELVEAMGDFNEEMAKAGVLLAAEGLHASAKGARIAFSGAKRTVTDGPFADTRELIAGLLADPDEVQGGGDRVGLALPLR